MNIAMIQSTPYPPEEGIGNYVANLSRELINRGHSVTVVTRGGVRRTKLQDDGIEIVRLPCPPLYPFHVDVHGVLVNRFLNRRTDQFDQVHSHTPLTPVIRTPLPLVATVHTSVVEDVKHVHGVMRLLTKLTMSVSSRRLVAGLSDAADRITTVSERVSGELSEHYGADNVAVVGNGVDADLFQPDRGGDERYVLFVGRLDYPKGVPDLIKAAKPIVKNHDIEFVITGKGPQREQYERMVEQAGLTDHVTFTGFVTRERQIQLYQNATVFTLPSHYEGLPTVLLEAMACGAPVVATDVGGCPEVIDHGENGLLVSPGDPAALSDAIDSVLGNAEMRGEFGRNARKTVLDRYTWDVLATEFEREYRLAMEAE